MQAEAERRKRAEILASEGHAQSKINGAQSAKTASVLAAEGEAAAILARAHASASAIGALAAALVVPGGRDAVSLRIAEQYVSAFGRVAKAGTTLLLPANAGDAAGMVAQAMSVFSAVTARNGGDAVSGSPNAAFTPAPYASVVPQREHTAPVGDDDSELRHAVDAAEDADRAAEERDIAQSDVGLGEGSQVAGAQAVRSAGGNPDVFVPRAF